MVETYVADFETSNDGESTHVWLWCVANLEGNIVSMGTTITAFMDWCFSIDSKNIWFHNLRYDGSYIIDWLLKNNYTHTKTKAIADMQVQTIVDEFGSWYALKACQGKNRKRTTITFYDSLKKINSSVADIAKRFKMEVTKGDIDHSIYRPIGYIPTPEEIDYCERDVKIIAKALSVLFEQGLTKMTASSDALYTYKQIIGKNDYANLFPSIQIDYDAIARKAYKGGYVYVNPLHQFDMLTQRNYDCGYGRTYDVNSLYPFIMGARYLPFGKPLYFVGKYVPDEIYNLYTQTLLVELRLKENHFPTIQTKGMLSNTDDKYLTNTSEPLILTLNSVDIELMFEHYEVEVHEYICGLKYMSQKGAFDEYIEKWKRIKENSTGGERESAKLMLNSLYGKFGMNPNRVSKTPMLVNDKVQWQREKPERIKPNYVPVASFITSWARDYVIRTAQRYYEHVAYIDTDSMHVVGDIEMEIDIHDTRFGAWKEEGTFTHSRFIRPKTYMEIDGDEYVIKCAGMPKESKKHVTYENFVRGSVFGGKLVPKLIEGGAILVEREFTIK